MNTDNLSEVQAYLKEQGFEHLSPAARREVLGTLSTEHLSVPARYDVPQKDKITTVLSRPNSFREGVEEYIVVLMQPRCHS